MRILVVDDEEIIQDFLKGFLREMGHEVETVSCGTEAVSKVLSFQFDIVFLDIALPDISGVEVLKRIRAQNQSVKVVMVTAMDERRLKKQVEELGVSGYLVKPFLLEEMLKLLR